MDYKLLNEKLQKFINEEESYEEKLQQVADEVKAKIEEIYGDDDLMEYFVVEPQIGKYDDGSTKYTIEVRGELGYDAMVDLASKLDEIVQQYDRYAYFDQVDGGIMEACIEFDKQPYVAPYQIVIEVTDAEPDTLYYDNLEEAEDICNQILNGPRKDEITKLVIEELKDGEYKVIKEFKGLVQESVEQTSVTFADRCNWINEDGKELQFAIEQIINKFDSYGNNYDEEKQQIIVDRILEILEQATTNLNDIAKRMK